MNAIAVREAAPVALALDRDRIDLIKRTVCPQGIPDGEFALFIEQCKRSGLDPLIKQAFCVERRMKLPNGTWGAKFEFQPSEAGMLARAEQMPDFRGITAQAVYESDEIEIDPGAGVVTHKFRPGKERGKVIGAWAKIDREARQSVVVWLNFDDYKQTTRDGTLTSMWAKLGATMITKCARVAALRVAYPAAFGGLYIREEMPQEEFVQRERPVQQIRQVEVVQDQPALEAPQQDPIDAQIAQARQMVAGIQSMEDWQAFGKDVLAQLPKGHPVRVAVAAEFNAKGAEFRKGAA